MSVDMTPVWTGVAPTVVALVGPGVLLLISSLKPTDLINDVEWETLLFFMGLFILAGALVHVGAMDALTRQLVSVTGGEVVPTLLLVLVGSAVVDTIPYVTAMSPVVASLVADNPQLGKH